MSFLLEECGVSNWIPDREAPKCHRCRTAFTFFHRRHHCRYCGGVFCGRCSFVMNKRYPPAHRKIRICVYCHTLYFRHKDMVQEGASFLKYTKDGKGQRSRHFWLTDVDGTQTIHWTDTNPKLALSAKHGEDRSLKLTEVKRILDNKEPGRESGPRKLIIKLESTIRDLILQTSDEQLFSGWLEALQAAHHVSHSTERITQWKQEKAVRDRDQERAKLRAERQARTQQRRQAAEAKFRKKTKN